MKKLKVYKMSLRLRLTLVTAAVITTIAVMLTLVSINRTGTIVLDSVAYVTTAMISPQAETSALPPSTSNASVSPGDIIYGLRTDPPGASLTASSNESISPYADYESRGISIEPIDENTVKVDAKAGTTGIATDKLVEATPPMSFFPGDQVLYEVPSSVLSGMQNFNDFSIQYMLIIIGVGTVLTWFALGRALKPVKKLSEEISGISENDLSIRIENFKSGDEISKLATSFNHMLERLEAAFESQKGFATAAAHELKTPLAAIKANIDVLEIGGSPTMEEYAETIEVAKNQTKRMISLVDDLFAMSATREYDFKDEVEMGNLLESIVTDLDHAIKAKDVHVSIQGDTKEVVTANAAMLQRAFSNLIENAVKYNNKGGSVEVDVQGQSHAVRVQIKDTGIGIGSEHTNKIFAPFYRVDTSRSRKIAGAGLGLAIAMQMIVRHGGTIEVAENEKGGSIFTVTLPRIL